MALAVVTVLGTVITSLPTTAPAQQDSAAVFDWRGEWAVEEGLALHPDTYGYQLPTAIAFVPRPGPGPKDPLYFVTELRGRVKVVTNDRTVYTFAENFFRSRPEYELPETEGETGLGGICLAPEQGYVFVTFAYLEGDTRGAASIPDGRPPAGVLRNGMVRFETTPETFATRPSGQVSLNHIFSPFEAAVSHQIGSCQVAGESLYVSVADGWQTDQSQEVNSLLGKVLRMRLDGQPAPGNPFLRLEDDRDAADFVWAYGFRNPFGLKVVGARLFVADNGLDLDRFLEVEPGGNYLWDGTDWSIGSRADVSFAPDIGPAQMEYYAGDRAFLPADFRRSFFLATSNPDRPGVLRLRYAVDETVVRGVPEFILRYQGSGVQLVTGVALGPDGLYVVPTLPDARGQTAVFRLSYDPGRPHPYLLTHTRDPEALMEERGCYGCHRIEGRGGRIGPPLDQPPLMERLRARLSSAAYLQGLKELERSDREPFRSHAGARAEVLRREGRERVRAWMRHRLREPKFDDPTARMPNLGLSESEAALLTDHLTREQPILERGRDALLRLIPPPLRPEPLMYRHLLFSGVGGLILGAAVVALLSALWRRRRGRRQPDDGRG